MTLEQKAGQMVMVRAFGRYENPRSKARLALLENIQELGIGGLVVFDSDLESIPRFLNAMQSAADIPLLISADLERGMAFRVRRGTVPLPYAMAVGATRSADAARFVGAVTARESRSVGIHWALAPVADVNNNPANPIINIRSFGEDPSLVATMTRAFLEGAKGEGVLTTVKHFPGHGDTAVDSHIALPTVTADRGRLDAVELAPFRAAVRSGVDAVMLGHIAVPALDPSGDPATLSAAIATDLLRDDLGFGGLIVTDAMEMGGVGASWEGGATVRAVQAGADVILLPPDEHVAVQSLIRAVGEGLLTEARLEDSVRRILEAKARMGLHRRRIVDPEAVDAAVGRPADLEQAATVAEAAITLVRNEDGIVPLRAEDPLQILHLVMSSHRRNRDTLGLAQAELARRQIQFENREVGPDISNAKIDEILARADDVTHVVVSAFHRVATDGGNEDMPATHVRLLRALHEAGRPVILISFVSPYLLGQVPEVPVYLCAFGGAPSSQRAAMGALFGELPVGGKLPVTLPGLYPYGHGLALDRRPMTLRDARAEDGEFRAGGRNAIDRVLESAIADQAFPGGVVAVGSRGTLAHLSAVGRMTYDTDAAAVAEDTIYDLASLTKVIATTTMAMILVDEGRLRLDSLVQEYLPRFVGANKDKVTVRHLLTHTAGVDWWAPLYEEIRGAPAYLDRIQAMDLVSEPGSTYLYSDLGLILLGEVLERVAGQPLQEFVEARVFEPLSMVDTGFRPVEAVRSRVAPTENDPWRGRLLHGEVHDENAFALGGVAPHAGLFGTASDLARFAQMMLNGGVLEHRRIVSRATIELFTEKAGLAGSTRALGWDTKSPEKSSAGVLFSPRSYGHTGFTGTSMWIDPDRALFVILLTNRVHPTRDNKQIRTIRPRVADAAVRALADPRLPPPVTPSPRGP